MQKDREAIERILKAIHEETGYEITIGGCGCCESPWVSIVDHELGEDYRTEGYNYNYD